MNMNIDSRQRRLIQGLARPVKVTPTGHPVYFGPMAVKAVIFDIYGTLLSSKAGDVGSDSNSGEQAVFEAALQDGGWFPGQKQEPRAEVSLLRESILRARQQRSAQGVSHPEVDIVRIWQEVLLGLGLTADDLDRVQLTALSYECRVNPVWPMAGLQQVLERLSGSGIQLGILSNAQFYTPVLLEVLLERPFSLFHPELLVWSYKELTAKPSLKLFELMNSRLAQIGIQPAEVAYVGNDLKKDIMPASTVGWRTVLFAGDSRSLRLHSEDPELAGVKPDMVINDIRQLLQIFV